MEGENVVAHGRLSFPVPSILKRIYDLAKLSNIFHSNPADYSFIPYLTFVYIFFLFFSSLNQFYFTSNLLFKLHQSIDTRSTIGEITGKAL